jgi:NAD-dependent DNA ligase
LLSLENSYNAEDLKERENRTIRILEKEENSEKLIDKLAYHIEPKFD